MTLVLEYVSTESDSLIACTLLEEGGRRLERVLVRVTDGVPWTETVDVLRRIADALEEDGGYLPKLPKTSKASKRYLRGE